MNKKLWTVTAVLVASAAASTGCKKADEDTAEQLARITSRLDAQDKKLDQILQKIGGRPGAQQRPPEPDPAVVYSVPIDGDVVRGPAQAKVTIVEAADFA
jgi:protein-disulfide isomerase